MADQPTSAPGGLHIGRLSLRVPGGGSEPRARGETIARGIGEALRGVEPGRQGVIPRMSLRVQVPHGASEALISQTIARAIKRRIS